MNNQNNFPISAKIYLRLRPLLIPFNVIEEHIPKTGTIVDIGCGYGIFASHIAFSSSKRNVIGIDLNNKRILLAKRKFSNITNLKFICNNITSSDIPRADVITAIDVIHHISTLELQEKLIKSCFSVLSEHGRLIIKDVDIIPRWKYWWNKIHDYVMTKGEPVLYQDQKTIRALLEKTGFSLEKIIKIKNYPYAHILYLAQKTGTN